VTEPAPLLEVSALSVVRGGAAILDIPSFALHRSETVALIGPNGTGKSTFLLALAGLLPTAGGRIQFCGQPVVAGYASTELRRRLVMVFQEPLLFDTTVYENVAVGLKFRNLPKHEINERVNSCLERLHIAHLSGRSARKLSGGEAQRTSLARAFASRPEVILLDEPFVALDPPARQALSNDLEQMLRESGTAAIITTHDQIDALRLADRISVMNRGRIVQSGTPSEVMNHPVNEFVATFAGMENIFSGTVAAAGDGLFSVAVSDRVIEATGDGTEQGKAVICIHPEHVALSFSNPADSTSSIRNVFPCRVSKVVSMGLFSKVYLECGFTLVASITNQSLASMALQPGMQLYASFKATAVHVLRKG